MTKSMGAAALKAAIRDGAELAILDVREEVDYFSRHLLFASCVPLGRLEMLVDDLVPRRGTRMAVVDADDGLAAKAAQRLESFGYTDVSALEGGIDAWAAAGYELFSGMHVPSKAFGELVEERCETPRMSAQELERRLESGEDIVILDSRPFDEFRRQSIPGGIDCPGAELAYRVFDVVQSPDTLVVVNCAGRTRSVIGAQSLINAGVRNRVVALQNGTMGWHLAGLALAEGETGRAPVPTPAGLQKARLASARVAAAAGVTIIDRSTYERWRSESAGRTLYVFDVRGPEEYAAGHLDEAVSAPGGQLVQETDSYAATRGARIVLVDDTQVRASMTGAWLRQMGWRDVAVLAGALTGQPLVAGRRRPRVLGLGQSQPALVDAPSLRRTLVDGGAAVVDFAGIRRFRAGHIPSAYFATRTHLPANLARLPACSRIVLTSTDGIAATLAVPEVAAATGIAPQVLEGGTRSWAKAGFQLERGAERFLDQPREIWTPYDRTAGAESEMRAYLNWEVGLVEQIVRDGDADFNIMPPPITP